MNSVFYNVAPDQLRYALVWEDSHALYQALDPQPNDHVLVITSAGCNALNLLLKTPASVTAIDLNPVQNELLRLKTHIIRHHDYAVFAGLLGFGGPPGKASAWQTVRRTLPPEQQRYWSPVLDSHPTGLLTAGKLDAYITGFWGTLDADTQQKLHRLTEFTDQESQRTFFLSELDNTAFKARFIDYFDRANLSKGRDPALFTYAQESGGAAFYRRLVGQVSRVLVRDNFFFRFFFFGPSQLPQAILPPGYQEANYAALRAALPRLTVVEGEAISYLLSANGRAVNKASLSNIFEYASQTEFRRVCRLLHERGHPLRFVFWNLLQEQGAFLAEDGWREIPFSPPTNQTACFYFDSIRAADTVDGYAASDGLAEAGTC